MSDSTAREVSREDLEKLQKRHAEAKTEVAVTETSLKTAREEQAAAEKLVRQEHGVEPDEISKKLEQYGRELTEVLPAIEEDLSKIESAMKTKED